MPVRSPRVLPQCGFLQALSAASRRMSDLLYVRRSVMTSIFGGLRERWRRMLCEYKSMAELAALPPAELVRIAQEGGVSASDLRSLPRTHDGPEKLMPQRLQQLGIDPAFVAQSGLLLYRDLERVCARCSSYRRCATDLASGDVQAGMQAYCPNASTMDALLVERAVAPPR